MSTDPQILLVKSQRGACQVCKDEDRNGAGSGDRVGGHSSELWHQLHNPGFPALKFFTLKMANKPKYGECGQEIAVSEPAGLKRAVLSEGPTGLCKALLGCFLGATGAQGNSPKERLPAERDR